MLGLDIPAIPIIHQYWITDAVPEVIERKRQGLPEMPILRDEGFEGYLREEGDGLMFGPYEKTEHLKLLLRTACRNGSARTFWKRISIPFRGTGNRPSIWFPRSVALASKPMCAGHFR